MTKGKGGSSSGKTPEGHCPSCGEPLKVYEDRCLNCGWEQ